MLSLPFSAIHIAADGRRRASPFNRPANCERRPTEGRVNYQKASGLTIDVFSRDRNEFQLPCGAEASHRIRHGCGPGGGLAAAAVIYDPPLIEGRLRRRHKRFLADVELADGSVLRAHCPNTGAMTGCSEPGSPVWLWDSGNAERKYRHTLELVASGEHLVCVNTARANQLCAEALQEGQLPPLAGYAQTQREPAIPGGKGRFDFLLSDPVRGQCYVELKSLTLHLGGGQGAFPDAVSDRALAHVAALRRVLALAEDKIAGTSARRECAKALPRQPAVRRRAVLIFCVLHSGVRIATTADDIQPAYGEQVRSAMAAGVEVLAWSCAVSTEGLRLDGPLPFVSPGARLAAATPAGGGNPSAPCGSPPR